MLNLFQHPISKVAVLLGSLRRVIAHQEAVFKDEGRRVDSPGLRFAGPPSLRLWRKDLTPALSKGEGAKMNFYKVLYFGEDYYMRASPFRRGSSMREAERGVTSISMSG